MYPEIETKEDSSFADKGTVTISDDLSKIKVVDKDQKTIETEFSKKDISTKVETDYVTKEIITSVRAYKVMAEGSPVVNHYYRVATKRSNEPLLTENTKVGTVTVHYVSNTGEDLKEPEKVVTDTPYEITKTYAVMSGTTKVGEEKVVETLTPSYDTKLQRFDKIIADKTGFTYEFDAVSFNSSPETGVIDKPQTIVSYLYRLVSEEDKTPTVTEAKGSVVVKYVDVDGNEIKDTENVVTDAVVKTTKTYATKSGDVVLSTRDEVEKHTVIYSAQSAKEQTITKDGKKYKFYGILPVDAKFNNITEEIGVVKEGVTTIVYQYVMQVDAPVVEVPEFNGGVNGIPEIHEKPEFTGSVTPLEPPILETPELVIPVVPMGEMSDPGPTEKPKPIIENPHVEQGVEVPQEEKTMLPNTGAQDSVSLTWLGMVGLFSVLGISKLKKKDD